MRPVGALMSGHPGDAPRRCALARYAGRTLGEALPEGSGVEHNVRLRRRARSGRER